MERFRSRQHPGNQPWALVYSRWSIRPLALAMLPVILGTSMLVLSGEAELSYLVWLCPMVYAGVAAWTTFDMQRTLAEIVINGDAATTRSVWDVAVGRKKVDWWHIMGLDERQGETSIVIGRNVYGLRSTEWSQLDALRQAAMAAMQR